jgi:hypothetical protein
LWVGDGPVEHGPEINREEVAVLFVVFFFEGLEVEAQACF